LSVVYLSPACGGGKIYASHLSSVKPLFLWCVSGITTKDKNAVLWGGVGAFGMAGEGSGGRDRDGYLRCIDGARGGQARSSLRNLKVKINDI